MMLLFKLLLALVLVLVVLLLIAVVRTLCLKPTSAKTATLPAREGDEARAAAYAKTLQAMIRQETISSRFEADRSKFLAFQESLIPLFPHVFLQCEIAHPGAGLVIKCPAKGTPTKEPILLMSHHDVVAAPPEGWSHPPFSGDLDENGCLWGRGTVDTKGSLFCELQALEELLAQGWQPACDVYITSSCTEEWSGESAPEIVRYLQEKGVHLGMLMDEGGMIINDPLAGAHGKYGVVGVLEKGYGDVRFTAMHHGGHASAPTKNTPLVRLGKFMAEVERKNPFAVQLTPTVAEMFRRLAPNMGFGMRLIFGNLWLFAPLITRLMPAISPMGAAMMQTTCAFTMAKGSDGLNVLPTEAYVTANLRFIHHQSNAESLAILEKIAAKYDLSSEVIFQMAPCTPVSYESDAFALIERTAAEIYPGYGVMPYVMTGGTDAKFYEPICENALRFAPIEITAQQLASVHARDENLCIASLPPAVDFYKTLLCGYTGTAMPAQV